MQYIQVVMGKISFSVVLPLQLTVVGLVPHDVDLYRVTLSQQRVQWYSTGVTDIWYQREG